MNDTFTPKTFSLPELKGISAKNIEEHLKLYKGYVTNANLILNKISELSKDSEALPAQAGNAYVLGELQRRFSFEFDGMRNHEYYFSSFEGGPHNLATESALKSGIEKEWGSLDAFMMRFKAIALTRGIGWAMLYYDAQSGHLLTQWVEEQHLGHLTGLSPVLALDMWEHAYVYDYPTSEKKKYVEAFFENLNWEVIEENFENSK
ncbi:MAG: Fe-Mn family superoxide dismutase [Patescibacteria group bacterium]